MIKMQKYLFLVTERLKQTWHILMIEHFSNCKKREKLNTNILFVYEHSFVLNTEINW